MTMYKKVLVAIDFSSSAEIIGRKALAIVDNEAERVHLCHVVEPILIDPSYDVIPVLPAEFEDELVETANKQLAQLGEQLGIEKKQQTVVVGTTKQQLLATAQEIGADLIVVGSHGRHGIALLLGSTANAVLHGAECDVLAVRVND